MTRPPDAQAMEKIAKDERIWITRDLDSGRFHLNEELASRWPNPEPPDEDEAPQGWRCNGRLRCGVGDEDGPSSPPVRLCDDATRLLALLCISIRSKTFFRETFYSPNFDPLRKQPSVIDVTVLCGPWTNTRSISCSARDDTAKWLESL